MKTGASLRQSECVAWIVIGVSAVFLLLAVLTRVAAATPTDPAAPGFTMIVSPFEGIFVADSPGAGDQRIVVGSRVQPETIVGQVEVWGRRRPVHARTHGTVTKVLVTDESPVTAQQPLFEVRNEPAPTPA